MRWCTSPAGLGALWALLVVVASARGAENPGEQAGRILGQVEIEVPTVTQRAATLAKITTPVEERVAAGEILLRNQDWERAIQVLSKVLELHAQGKAPATARADAEFLIGEAYLGSNQHLAARHHFLEVVRRADTPPCDVYAGRAVSRVVDIALRTSDDRGLDEVVAKLERLPPSDSSGSLAYARGKAYLAQGRFDRAREALRQLPTGSAYAPQAGYLLGVVLTKEVLAASAAKEGESSSTGAPATSRFDAAVAQFAAVARMPVKTAEHHHVVDLANMAMGRLHYETNHLLEAADAYQKVGRESPEFSAALFELAWAHARLGDYQAAQRALEVLSITDPKSLRMVDGSLLRADLLLRSGQFDKALSVYEGVRTRYDPAREQVTRLLATQTDPALYYDKLVADRLEQQSGDLSPLVIEWAREEAENERAFTVIEDVARTRDLIRRSRRLAAQLRAVFSSPTRVRAFPELKQAMEHALGALNRVSEARLILARGLDEEARDEVPADLSSIRKARRALMKRLGQLPISPGDFVRRESSGEVQWNAVSQQLQRMTLEVDKLQAIVNGLGKMLREADQYRVQVDPATRERLRTEIEANQRDMAGYRARIDRYREALENGRVQIGFGDSRYVEDAQIRRSFRELFKKEAALVGAGRDGADAVEYIQSIRGLLARAEGLEATLESKISTFEQGAAQRTGELDEAVKREAELVEVAAQGLDGLDQQARLLLGAVAMNNFALVRDRLKSIVLRADVGIVQQAWEVREERRMRVLDLQRERAREEQNLNDELREVLDDAEGAL